MKLIRLSSLILLALTLSTAAHAQWVMVAKAVSGRVQQMQQQKSANGGGYDVATVILEAKAENVYQTALSTLKAHSPEVTVTSSDDKKYKVNFTNGQQNASMQATSLGPTITQLVIASSAPEAGQSGASMVLQGVMKICKQMNITCKVED